MTRARSGVTPLVENCQVTMTSVEVLDGVATTSVGALGIELVAETSGTTFNPTHRRVAPNTTPIRATQGPARFISPPATRPQPTKCSSAWSRHNPGYLGIARQ